MTISKYSIRRRPFNPLHLRPQGRLMSRHYIVSLCPKVPVPKLILQIRMPIEHHQRAFPFQVSHERRHTDLRWYAHQHVHMVWHQMPFYNLYAFVCAKIMQDLSQIFLVLIVDYFSSILWRKDDMVLAQPFSMCSTISLWQEITFPFSVVAWTPLLYGKVISLLNDLSPPA